MVLLYHDHMVLYPCCCSDDEFLIWQPPVLKDKCSTPMCPAHWDASSSEQPSTGNTPAETSSSHPFVPDYHRLKYGKEQINLTHWQLPFRDRSLTPSHISKTHPSYKNTLINKFEWLPATQRSPHLDCLGGVREWKENVERQAAFVVANVWDILSSIQISLFSNILIFKALPLGGSGSSAMSDVQMIIHHSCRGAEGQRIYIYEMEDTVYVKDNWIVFRLLWMDSWSNKRASISSSLSCGQWKESPNSQAGY